MEWIKKGIIYCPADNYQWMASHASNPVAEGLGEALFRLYFSCRDKNNRSSIAFVDVDIRAPSKSLRVAGTPVIGPGQPGFFDDSGASMGCLVRACGKTYLYYLGWNLGVTVPWRNSIGLAMREVDEGPFKKHSRAPILDRSEIDPFSLSYPWVMRDGTIWKMWYGSNLNWGYDKADMTHVIRYAESSDGVCWERKGFVAIPLKPGEVAVARPCVLKEERLYKMWYSYRGQSYRIGYAESPDGVHWKRKDNQVGIDVSKSGWDSEMIEYPFVFDHEGQRYMLYNGNGYGKTGFGLAVLKK
jgi:hypothetical protein